MSAPSAPAVAGLRTAHVDGILMRWVERGEGPPVVLVHGIPTSLALWRKVLPRVEGARLLAWEMVGYGESIPAGHGLDLSVARQAAHLRSWMRAVGVERAVLVGHDLGGGVAQIVAVREPALCAGLVVTNGVAYDSWPVPSVKAMRAAGPLVSRLPMPLLRMALSMLFVRGHDRPEVARESMAIHLAPYARHGGGRPLVRQMRALDDRDTRAVADGLPTLRGRPVRIVWGAADSFQKLRYGERLAADLGGELVAIEGGKHFVPEDHPEEIARAVAEVVAAARWTDGG